MLSTLGTTVLQGTERLAFGKGETMEDYSEETSRRLDVLREVNCHAYIQLVYGPAFQLSESAMREQLDMVEEENGVIL